MLLTRGLSDAPSVLTVRRFGWRHFVVDLVQYASFLLLLGSFFVPLFGVLLAQWLVGEGDPFAAREVRLGQVVAWLAGFGLYQWLSPRVRPGGRGRST